MLKAIIFIILLSLNLIPISASGGKKKKVGTLIFEGVLLAKSDRDRQPACGVLFIHQVAKYRVTQVVKGRYEKTEIVIDHQACDQNILRGINVSDKIKLIVEIYQNYDVITYAPGIREQQEKPLIFYVAAVPPERIGT